MFKTFGCDHNAIDGESYLRADYSLSCETTTHALYKVYAGFMLLVGDWLGGPLAIKTHVLTQRCCVVLRFCYEAGLMGV